MKRFVLPAVVAMFPIPVPAAVHAQSGPLDAGPSPAPGVDLFAHCLVGAPGGVALVAVNTDRAAARELTMPVKGERYTLAASPSRNVVPAAREHHVRRTCGC